MSFVTPITLAQEGPAPIDLGRDQISESSGIWERAFFGSQGFDSAAQASDGLYMLIFWFSTFFFVLLMVLMVYWVIKYRRRPGVPAPVSPSHNTLLEVFWTIVPSSSLLVMFFLGFWTYMERQVASSDALQLEVQGYTWGWTITYPDGTQPTWSTKYASRQNPDGSVTESTQPTPIFVVPENTNIRLRMISSDVIHSFWIPDLRMKMDLMPNRYTGYTFRSPDLPSGEDFSDHWVFCAEYCGNYHSEMAAIMRVVSAAEYRRILTEEFGEKPYVETGEIVWRNQCAICHSVDGKNGTGPTWAGGVFPEGERGLGYTVRFNDGSELVRDEEYIIESIQYPQRRIVEGNYGAMPAFQLSERQLIGVVEYMKTISDRGGELRVEEAEAAIEEGAEASEEDGSDG
ncbi:MAG: c-type cytochrome [Planctomycetota bacterium]